MSTLHWIIVLVVVLLVFGTKRLTSGARDVGRAVNEFKKGMHGDDGTPPTLRDERAADARGVVEDERHRR